MTTPSKDQPQPSPFAGFGATASGQKSDQPNPFAGFASLANSGTLLFGNTSSSTPTFSFNASTFGTASNKKDENSVDKKDDDDEDDEGDDGDDGGAVADESHAADFKPIVELTPVVFKSYEEEEEVMFKTRAKLFKFVKEDTYGGEVRTNYWKERGLGDIKVLKHKTTGECRLLMHQEKTLKICLNHKISPITELVPMQGADGKAWTFSALDFADEELKQDTFALKVASPEIAKEFKKAFDAARELNKTKKGGSSEASSAAPSSPAKAPAAPGAPAATPAQPPSPEKPAASASSAPASVEAVAKDVSKLNMQAPQPAIAGGWQKRDPEDPEIKNVARFACDKIGKGSLVRVASVKSQVVAGMNFRIALHIKHADGKVFAHVVTVFQPLPHTKEPLSLKEQLITGQVA